jgi:hypothetical protein
MLQELWRILDELNAVEELELTNWHSPR